MVKISHEMIADILKTLPIGYYLGTRTAVVYEQTGGSYCNLMDGTIHVSGETVMHVLAGLPDTADAEEVENATRAILYHELSHVICTPKMGVSDPRNIFEDERIETLLSKYYLGVDFKRACFAANGWTPDWKPDNALKYFFGIVRFRQGPEYFVKKVAELIKKWAKLRANAGRYDTNDFAYDIDCFWEEVQADWNKNSQKRKQEQQQRNDQRNGKSQDKQQAGGNSDQQQNESGDQQNGGTPDKQDGDSKQDAGDKNAKQPDQGGGEDAEDKDGENKPQNGEGSENGESEEDEEDEGTSNGGSGSDGEDEEDDADDDADGNGGGDSESDDEEQDGTEDGDGMKDGEGANGHGNTEGDNAEDADESKGKGNAGENDTEDGTDEGDSDEGDAEKPGDKNGDDDAISQAKQEQEQENADEINDVTRESIAEDFKKLLNTFHEEKVGRVLERLIIQHNKKRASRTPMSLGYTGKVDVKKVATQRDYRWFARKGGDGQNRFGATHLTLWVDCSGSFDQDIGKINAVIHELNLLARRMGREFSFDVVKMTMKNTVVPTTEPLRATGCNGFGPGVEECLRKTRKQGCNNYNVVVWDGNMFSGFSRSTREQWIPILRRAFNNQDTVLVTDNENEDYIKTYCPMARSRIIHGNYAGQFVDALLELLSRVLV